MSVILNIDTALSIASVSVCTYGNILSSRINANDRDHAAWIIPAIDECIKEAGIAATDIKAVAVSHGPGSYTGLRIGLSTAKGLCYALNLPLITIPTLEIMAAGIVEIFPQHENILEYDLLCPVIDARRDEIYFALYDTELNLIHPSSAVVLDKFDFSTWLMKNKIIFFGNGSDKLKNITSSGNAFFKKFDLAGALYMKKKSLHYYDNKVFADVALSEPLYIKEFYDGSSK
jgi:tRNA threonylcarbamoyladenosine biosynthesis protein TsaB